MMIRARQSGARKPSQSCKQKKGQEGTPKTEQVKEAPKENELNAANVTLAAMNVAPNDILLKFFSLTPLQLRIVFDKAVSDWNEKKTYSENAFNKKQEEFSEEIEAAEEQIEQLLNQIDAKRGFIKTIQADIERSNNVFSDEVVLLDNQRTMIENMQAVMADKLKGFKE